ncbi:substrate-binding periplasmic protein [Inhella sp.]|uniref:substrate-binding periplasmic protein n=1 Tax=Inhella sp. TaxID=1921806 RepID=UPI0035AEF0AD
MQRRALFALSPGLGLPLRAQAEPLEVVYPRVDERGEQAYGYRLLDLALRRSGQPYQLRMGDETLGPQGLRRALGSGAVDVMDMGTGPELEDRYEPVFFPIDLGLSGWRCLLVRRDRAAEVAAVRSLAGLRRFRVGQGPGWADQRILEAAGLAVDTAPFKALFRMLQGGRFDVLPLGIEEAQEQLRRHQALAPDCEVLEQPLLHYRFARLYFVAPGRLALRDALQRGLESAFEDGSLRRLLAASPGFARWLQRTEPLRAQVLELPNAGLSARFRAMPERYFARL